MKEESSELTADSSKMLDLVGFSKVQNLEQLTADSSKMLGLADFSQIQNLEQFIINGIEEYPNRLICFIKFKMSKGKQKISSGGTGCLIDQKYVLTSAHTIEKFLDAYEAYRDDPNSRVEGYIKQALHEGKAAGQYKIKGQSIKMSRFYRTFNKKQNDYALFQIEPYPGQKIIKQDKYVPVVAFKEKDAHQVTKISLYGYDYQANKKISKNNVPSSIYMAYALGASGPPLQFLPKKVTYKLPIGKGVSGGPIMTYNPKLCDFVVFGIHKASVSNQKNDNKSQVNFGVTSLSMLSQVNQWGYQLCKKPFIYTKQTFFMRNNPAIQKLDTFNLLDSGLDHWDMMVLTGFELSHLKKLILSGNHLQEKGLKYLLKRRFPNLELLMLAQNNIESLASITDDQWKNIEKVTKLSLSLNKISSLPNSFKILSQLQILWLGYNKFEEIPAFVTELNEKQPIIKRTIHIYQNQLKSQSENAKLKESLEKKSVYLLLNKSENQ